MELGGMGMGNLKMPIPILWVFMAIAVLFAGCEKEEKVATKVEESGMINEVHQTGEIDVDDYWSQPVESELCRTVVECRDLGDTYGSEHFDGFRRGLAGSNELWYLNTGTEIDEYGYNEGYKDEESILARYEIRNDEFVLTSGLEESIFENIADIVFALYDRSKIDFRVLDFQENVYPHVVVYDGKLGMLADNLTQWYQPYTIAILLHEYGHMLTMRESDLTVDESCPNGCFSVDSYMNLYHEEFLAEFEEQWLNGGYEKSEERMVFYEKHRDSFVTTYATVSPYEDIAESFAHFMLSPYNENPQTIPERKINFFYQFPELVEYRAFVLKTLNERKAKMDSFY